MFVYASEALFFILGSQHHFYCFWRLQKLARIYAQLFKVRCFRNAKNHVRFYIEDFFWHISQNFFCFDSNTRHLTKKINLGSHERYEMMLLFTCKIFHNFYKPENCALEFQKKCNAKCLPRGCTGVRSSTKSLNG